MTCMAKVCPSSLAKISSSVLPGVFRLVHSPLLQGGALAAILDFLQALVQSKTSNLGYRYDCVSEYLGFFSHTLS